MRIMVTGATATLGLVLLSGCHLPVNHSGPPRPVAQQQEAQTPRGGADQRSAPKRPTNVKAIVVRRTSSGIKLRWYPPDHKGPKWRYEVRISGPNVPIYGRWTRNGRKARKTYIRYSGAKYWVQVRVVNKRGAGPAVGATALRS